MTTTANSTQNSTGAHNRRVERDTDGLRDRVLRMAELCEGILAKSLRAVWERDPRIAAEVKQDDLPIDRLDVEIDEDVMRVLALDAPVARDLRLVVAILSITTDLERVGDLARNIAGCARRLTEHAAIEFPSELETLAQEARRALSMSVASFAELDAAVARQVLANDDAIDALEKHLVGEAVERIAAEPTIADQQIDLIFITQNLERIGDHATNIAEETILAAEAKNLKHASKLGTSTVGP